MTIDDRELFRTGYLAGFDCSREGWNGECAYTHLSGVAAEVDEDDVDGALDLLCERAWQTHLAEHKR